MSKELSSYLSELKKKLQGSESDSDSSDSSVPERVNKKLSKRTGYQDRQKQEKSEIFFLNLLHPFNLLKKEIWMRSKKELKQSN